jgi:hypothetical protein
VRGFFAITSPDPSMFDIFTITFFDSRTLLGTSFAITPCLMNLPIVDLAFGVI